MRSRTVGRAKLSVFLITCFALVALTEWGSFARKAYPACDNSVAQAELAGLYDNKRLLHAVDVSDLHFLDDTFSARHCAATVRWGNGSISVVNYEFDRVGSRNYRGILMWTDYNGGMHGPGL
jgi:hypothetical protein